MTPDTSPLYENLIAFCKVYVMWKETPWHNFARRRILKDALNHYYPLVSNHILTKSFNGIIRY